MSTPVEKELPKYHVGCLGGGQLGRMMAQAASRLGVKMTVLDPAGLESPAGAVCGHAVQGSITDPAKVRELAEQVDVMTVEIEHVDTSALAELEAKGKPVHPAAATLSLIQDKFAQKQHLAKLVRHAPPGAMAMAALVASPDRTRAESSSGTLTLCLARLPRRSPPASCALAAAAAHRLGDATRARAGILPSCCPRTARRVPPCRSANSATSRTPTHYGPLALAGDTL